jgi:hypothetical protein
MHIENPKLKYNQTIVTWKGLHQHPIGNLTAHRGAGMASCHGILLFNLSGFQERTPQDLLGPLEPLAPSPSTPPSTSTPIS